MANEIQHIHRSESIQWLDNIDNKINKLNDPNESDKKMTCFLCNSKKSTDEPLGSVRKVISDIKKRFNNYDYDSNNIEENKDNSSYSTPINKIKTSSFIYPCSCDQGAHISCITNMYMTNMNLRCSKCKNFYPFNFKNNGSFLSTKEKFFFFIFISILLSLSILSPTLSILFFNDYFEIKRKYYFWNYILGATFIIMSILLSIYTIKQYRCYSKCSDLSLVFSNYQNVEINQNSHNNQISNNNRINLINNNQKSKSATSAQIYKRNDYGGDKDFSNNNIENSVFKVNTFNSSNLSHQFYRYLMNLKQCDEISLLEIKNNDINYLKSHCSKIDKIAGFVETINMEWVIRQSLSDSCATSDLNKTISSADMSSSVIKNLNSTILRTQIDKSQSPKKSRIQIEDSNNDICIFERSKPPKSPKNVFVWKFNNKVKKKLNNNEKENDNEYQYCKYVEAPESGDTSPKEVESKRSMIRSRSINSDKEKKAARNIYTNLLNKKSLEDLVYAKNRRQVTNYKLEEEGGVLSKETSPIEKKNINEIDLFID